MVEFHREKQALATLAVQERKTSRHLLFDDELQLCGRQTRDEAADLVRPASPAQRLGFCGVHVISPRIFPLLSEEGVFSIIPAYLRLASEGERILGFRADEYSWRDLGKIEDVSAARA
jgi:NDP-sugar pyrophosphorylase family protein